MLYNAVLDSAMNQPQVYIRPHPLEPPSPLPPLASPLGGRRAPGVSSCVPQRSPPFTHFANADVCSVLFSATPSPTVSTSVVSGSVSPLLP